jgi:undecaprenyl-diphosphatase
MSLETQSISAGGGSTIDWPALLAGAVTAFLVGVLCLKLLLKAVKMMKLHWFAYYCIAMSVGTIIWQLSVGMSAAGP